MEFMYNQLSYDISKLVTRTYSTSFSIAVSFLGREMRKAIYSIYGFVRLADEIVDSFHSFDKNQLLEAFEQDYYRALKDGISINPVLNSFQLTVRKYRISDCLVRGFLKSMKYDLESRDYQTTQEMDDYIYGSAEVVGLMCLKVFLNGDDKRFEELQQPARKLGAAFQKVNFLRDIKNDIYHLGRRYFPETVNAELNDEIKERIVSSIRQDFIRSYPGIRALPGKSRLGVLIAYQYYLNLLERIERMPASDLLKKRIRVPDYIKFLSLVKAIIKHKLNLI